MGKRPSPDPAGNFYGPRLGRKPSASHNGPMSESQNLLQRAAALAGGIRELARRLHVPSKQLTSWIEGEVPTPATVFQRALVFVTPKT